MLSMNCFAWTTRMTTRTKWRDLSLPDSCMSGASNTPDMPGALGAPAGPLFIAAPSQKHELLPEGCKKSAARVPPHLQLDSDCQSSRAPVRARKLVPQKWADSHTQVLTCPVILTFTIAPEISWPSLIVRMWLFRIRYVAYSV